MPFFQEGETPLMVGYLAAQGSGQEGCLLRAACQSPKTAAEYSRAARALLQGTEIFDPSIAADPKYNLILNDLDRASMEGLEKAPCELIYPCHL